MSYKLHWRDKKSWEQSAKKRRRRAGRRRSNLSSASGRRRRRHLRPEKPQHQPGNRERQRDINVTAAVASFLRQPMHPQIRGPHSDSIVINQWHGFSQGECFARKAATPTLRHGRNVWQSVTISAIRILCLRTSSGVLTLTVLLELPVILRHASLPVWLAVVYKFEIHPETVDQVRPNRPCKPLPTESPLPDPVEKQRPGNPDEPAGDIPGTSA